MFGLPMEIVGPVIGIGAIIMLVAGGIVTVRFLTSKISRPDAKAAELDQLTQRLSELEERVDFTERLLAKQREGLRLGPSQK